MEGDGSGVPSKEEGQDNEKVAHWQRRPWARTFDLIQSEYGWTDQQVLDLPLARLRQIRDVITERQIEDRVRLLKLEEFKLQTLASFMARSDAGVKAAMGIRLLKGEEKPQSTMNPIPLARAKAMFHG